MGGSLVLKATPLSGSAFHTCRLGLLKQAMNGIVQSLGFGIAVGAKPRNFHCYYEMHFLPIDYKSTFDDEAVQHSNETCRSDGGSFESGIESKAIPGMIVILTDVILNM